MRWSKSPLALCALLLSAQAQAGLLVKLDITADITNTYDDDPNPESGSHSNYLGSKTWSVEGPEAEMDLTSDAYLQLACARCMNPTFSDNELTIAVDPFFVHTYGGTWLTLVFDHDLNGDFSSATTETFVSGHFSSLASAGPLFNNFAGPITALSLSVTEAVPEPASWALMVAGFAGIGGALRQGRRRTAIAH